jgi:hypothetical protein
VYRESIRVASGATLRGSAGAIISGLEPLENLTWSGSAQRCIYRAAVDTPPIPQLFYDGAMMVEARWPNIDHANVGDASMSQSAWATVRNGSAYGRLVQPGLRANFSWVGALATLNVGHQWNSWTRNVTGHSGDAIEYPQDLPGLAGYDPTIYPSQARACEAAAVITVAIATCRTQRPSSAGARVGRLRDAEGQVQPVLVERQAGGARPPGRVVPP